MHTTNQFETALIALNVKIDEIRLQNKFVTQAVGYLKGKTMTWNDKGQCSFKKERLPQFDLDFTGISAEENEKN